MAIAWLLVPWKRDDSRVGNRGPCRYLAIDDIPWPDGTSVRALELNAKWALVRVVADQTQINAADAITGVFLLPFTNLTDVVNLTTQQKNLINNNLGTTLVAGSQTALSILQAVMNARKENSFNVGINDWADTGPALVSLPPGVLDS